MAETGYEPYPGVDTSVGSSTPQSSGGGIMDILSSVLGGVNGALGGGNNAATLATVAALMQMLQGQMNKSVTSPKEAVTASENMRQYYTDRRNETGAPQSMINSVQSALTNRASQAPLTPTVSAPAAQPARFNPYANGGGIGGASSDVMSKLNSIVSSSNPSQAWGMNLAQNSLANRFGVRDMAQNGVSGQLRPQPLPAGATNTNNPYLPVGTQNRNPNGTLDQTYGMNQNNVPAELQSDFATFQKGPTAPGYLGAFVKLTNYFSSGKTPQAAAQTPSTATPTNPYTSYTPDPNGLSEAARLAMGY